MIYEYECEHCGERDDIQKSIDEYDRIETCPECTSPMKRLVSAGYFMGEKVETAYFNHGLGRMVSGDTEAKQVAKDRGLIEVGNEVPKKHIKPPKRQEYLED